MLRTICLCLPEKPDRIEAAKAHFAARGVTAEFFWGIHATTAGLITTHPYEVDNPGSGFRMGAGPTGCWLSHYMLWSALQWAPDERVLVLEDDAELAPDFVARLEQALIDAPANFDLLYVGSCCTQGHKRDHVKGDVYKIDYALCTHAYVLRRAVVPTLLRTLRKVWAPIDIQLVRECFPQLATYAILPRIASQFNTVIPE